MPHLASRLRFGIGNGYIHDLNYAESCLGSLRKPVRTVAANIAAEHIANTIVMATKTVERESAIWNPESQQPVTDRHKGSMNLSTHDAIEYDLASLEAMSTGQLLIQLIARKDLERPNREGQLKSREYFEKVVAQMEATIAKLEAQNLPYFADGVRRTLEEYKASAAGA